MYQHKPYPQLGITNFWSSESYFFHTTDQMILTAAICPNISDMLFMYQDRYICDLNVLQQFRQLGYLEFWGGDFYVDKMYELFENIGGRLVKLDLHHINNLDERAIALIAINCGHLEFLGFSVCVFFDPDLSSLGDDPEDETYVLHHLMLRKETQALITPLLDLQVLSIQSKCPKSVMATIISLGLNIKRLELGINTKLTDEFFDEVFKVNKLKHLEHLVIKGNHDLSMRTVSNVLFYCDKIMTMLDLDCWNGVDEEELQELSDHLNKNNADIVLREKEKDLRYATVYELYQRKSNEKYHIC